MNSQKEHIYENLHIKRRELGGLLMLCEMAKCGNSVINPIHDAIAALEEAVVELENENKEWR